MAVVSASHSLGYGKARLTVLGKMASIRRLLPMGPGYSTSIRDLAVWNFSGSRMILAALYHKPSNLVPLSHV